MSRAVTALSLPWRRRDLAQFALVYVLVAAAFFYLAAAVANGWPDSAMLDKAGRPIGRDFIAFFSASVLALEGTAENVYDPEIVHALQIALVGAPVELTAWHYPPTFLLAVLPLAQLPYPLALALWQIVPVALFIVVAHRLFAFASTAWLLPLFPAVTLCLISGQNGIITATLFGAAFLALDRRPLLAGFCFGLLTYKPHLALLIAPALIAGRHWRALAGMAVTAVAFVAASVWAFGRWIWRVFLENLDFVAYLVDEGMLPWARMPTVYLAGRLLGIDDGLAHAIQIAVALAAVAAVCAIWRRRPPLALRGAALAVAIPLATPYLFDYDLVVVALAIGWLAQLGLREGWRSGEIALLSVAWVSPALFWPLAAYGGVPLTPLLQAALLAAVARRVFWPAVPRAPQLTDARIRA